MAFPELLEQVRKEVQTGYHPRLLSGTSNAKPYSVIFVGSPNWCGSIAPPLVSWLAKNDLSGKIILPFYSHCGGVACNFQREIARLCPRADVRKELGILENLGADLPRILQDWLDQNSLQSLSGTYTGDQYKEIIKKEKNYAY